MAYSPFDSTKPVGSDTGPNIPVTAKTNERALRDAAIMGAMRSFDYSQSGGTARQPATIFFKNVLIWVRGAITWGTTSGEKYNPTQIVWSLTVDNGSNFDTIATQTFTYDSSGNITAMTNASALCTYLLALFGRVRIAEEAIADHVADVVADAPHGIASMAGQAASAVAITDGAIRSQTQQVKMPAGAALGTKNAAFDIDLSLGHFFTVTIQAGAVATFINKPAAGTVHHFTIKIVNGGLVADQVLFPGCKAPAGAISLSSSGTDLLHGMISDGATIEFTGVSPAMATLS